MHSTYDLMHVTVKFYISMLLRKSYFKLCGKSAEPSEKKKMISFGSIFLKVKRNMRILNARKYVSLCDSAHNFRCRNISDIFTMLTLVISCR